MQQLTWFGSSLVLMVVYLFAFAFVLLCLEQPRKMLWVFMGTVLRSCGLGNNEKVRKFLRRTYKKDTDNQPSNIPLYLLVIALGVYVLGF